MVKDDRIEKDKATNSLYIVFKVDSLTSLNQNFKQYLYEEKDIRRRRRWTEKGRR